MDIDKTRSDQLQFLRFCSFLLIYFFHTGEYQPAWFPGANGAANAVDFFILLSGFVSGISSYGREESCAAGNVFCYIKKKIVRLYPLYFVTTVFTIIYSPIPSFIAQHSFSDLKEPFIQLLKNLVLMQSWFPTGYFSFNAVGWFLSTIMFLYLITIPLRAAAAVINKTKKRAPAFAAICLFSYLLIWVYCYLTRKTNMEFTQYVFPLSRAGEYICGMSLGYLLCPFSSKLRHNISIAAGFTFLEAISLTIWLIGMYAHIRSWHFRIIHWLPANILLITVFYPGRGLISRLFRLNLPRYLGDITFECFLLHQIILNLYRTINGSTSVSRLGNTFSIVFCLVITIALASLISKKTLLRSALKP